MAKSIEVLGGVLVTNTGIVLAGELGIDKDIDLVAGMFSAVSNFMEETFEKSADQIKLGGGEFITKSKGKFITIWITSNGASKVFANGVKELLEKFEDEHYTVLEKWKGTIDRKLAADFDRQLKLFSARMILHVSQDVEEVSLFGFDHLDKELDNAALNEIEDAFDLYFLTGEHDLALKLAEETSKNLQMEKNNKHSSLFDALAARVIVNKKGDRVDTKLLLGGIISKAEDQKNFSALVEGCEAFSNYYLEYQKVDNARNWHNKAIEALENIQERDMSWTLRKLNLKLTEAVIHFHEGEYPKAIEGWSKVLWMIKEIESELDFRKNTKRIHKIILGKQRMRTNNNIGFTMLLKNRLEPQTYEKALPFLEEAHDLAVRSNALWFRPVIAGNLAMAYAFLGKANEAENLASDVYKIVKDDVDNTSKVYVERCLGVINYRKGIKESNIDYLYESMYWFNTALKGKVTDAEAEYINFFKQTCKDEIYTQLEIG